MLCDVALVVEEDRDGVVGVWSGSHFFSGLGDLRRAELEHDGVGFEGCTVAALPLQELGSKLSRKILRIRIPAVEGRVEKDLKNTVVRHRDTTQRQSCNQAHVRLMIHHDGKVGPCCPAIKGDLIIGDVNTQTVSEVFNSYQARTLRKELKNGKAFETNPCKTCSSFESYANYKPNWNS